MAQDKRGEVPTPHNVIRENFPDEITIEIVLMYILGALHMFSLNPLNNSNRFSCYVYFIIEGTKEQWI